MFLIPLKVSKKKGKSQKYGIHYKMTFSINY